MQRCESNGYARILRVKYDQWLETVYFASARTAVNLGLSFTLEYDKSHRYRRDPVTAAANSLPSFESFCSSPFTPQAAWSEAFDSLKAARSRVRACQQDVRNKFDEARPLQEALKRIQEGNSAARARGRSLEATSEAELNAMVRGGWNRVGGHERVFKWLNFLRVSLLEASKYKNEDPD